MKSFILFIGLILSTQVFAKADEAMKDPKIFAGFKKAYCEGNRYRYDKPCDSSRSFEEFYSKVTGGILGKGACALGEIIGTGSAAYNGDMAGSQREAGCSVEHAKVYILIQGFIQGSKSVECAGTPGAAPAVPPATR